MKVGGINRTKQVEMSAIKQVKWVKNRRLR